MGCNTSKEPLASTDADKEAETNKEDGNNVEEVNGQSEEKPPSAKTITLKSASNSKPNSATPEGTKNDVTVEEEELDPELDQAAVKIQAVFRGHQTRKTMKQEDKSTKSKSAQEQQQLEDEFSSDDVELTHAATKIQASFRGHMVRKQMEKDEEPQKPEHPTPEEEELDIDLTDPELHKAATKIQASFRGHSSRRDAQDPPTSASNQK